MNKLVKSLLRITLNVLDQSDRATSGVRDHLKDRMDDLSDRIENITDRTRYAITGRPNTALRCTLSFAAGIGVGVGVGLLLAPASGEETRNTIAEKMQDAGNRVRDRISGVPSREAV